jgi:hypothetical protein
MQYTSINLLYRKVQLVRFVSCLFPHQYKILAVNHLVLRRCWPVKSDSVVYCQESLIECGGRVYIEALLLAGDGTDKPKATVLAVYRGASEMTHVTVVEAPVLDTKQRRQTLHCQI